MKGDFTRNTFDPLRHFSRVLMQQGRVQLDADFNEQAAILLHYLRTLATDLIGSHGGPDKNLGFTISFPQQGNDGNFTISKGRYYVDGILCENDKDLKYNEQEGFKYMPLPANNKTYYAYLDVWERHITPVQDDRIREVALGGPDTCTRAKVIWQVKLKDIAELEGFLSQCTGEKSAQAWITLLKLSNVKMRARVRPSGEYEDPCSIPPESRYRGLENQLYRIEVHRGGKAWDGTTNKGMPAGNAGMAATFKWSRDNGSLVYPIVQQQGNVVTLQSLERDQRTRLQDGDWVEITDDDRELRGEPGILAQVDKVDSVEMTVTLRWPSDGGSLAAWPEYNESSSDHPLLRRWDHRAIEGVEMYQGAILISESDSEDGWIEIGDGIEVQFQPPAAQDGEPPLQPPAAQDGEPPREYRTGDYWLVPARVATGKIDWPPELDEQGNELPKALGPHGIEHHYAPLAVIKNRNAEENDCRCSIKPEKILQCPPSG